MQTEIEAKFIDVDINDVRNRLEAAGAKLVQPMRMMRRVTIDPPGQEAADVFLRVRDEGDKATMTYKSYDDITVDGANEIEVEVSDFQLTVDILASSGLVQKSYQESKRESWQLDGCEIELDEWPWLNPYIEIEGPSVDAVQALADKLGFDWEQAVYGGVAYVYQQQYPDLFTADEFNSQLARIKFDDPPPELLG